MNTTMKGVLRYFLAIVGGLIFLVPLGALFDRMNWPVFHGWGLIHGSFIIAWPLLTWLLLKLGPWIKKLRARVA